MPHLIIEHSSNLSVPAATLLNSLHQAAEQTQLFDPSSIKSRMLSFEHHKLGNDKEGFIHVHAGIHGIGDLIEAERDWRNPVARIAIIQTSEDSLRSE